MPPERKTGNAEAWDRLYSREGRAWRGAGLLEMELLPGTRVLEIGCGNGKTFSSLIESGCEAVGLDISGEAVRLCRERFGEEWQFIRGDVLDLPFDDRAFDLVLLVHVLEHLDVSERGRAMDEVLRVLAPGGRMFIRAFSREDMRYGKGEPTADGGFLRGNGIEYHYFDEQDMRALLPPSADFELRHVWDRVKHAKDGKGRARWELTFFG